MGLAFPLEKKLFARQAEVFAGYAAYTDSEIGRVIQAVEDMGKLDNTLIVYICGDNGTSPEGTLYGAFNQLTAYNGILKAPEALQMLHLEDWGSDKTYPHMAVGWALAFDTPFQWTKQVASHFGGTRQGMAISWPGHIKDVGPSAASSTMSLTSRRPSWKSRASTPVTVNGITQRPIEGVSMAYTFDEANAKVPSKRETQYFELVANRGIYHDGWIANTIGAIRPALGPGHWQAARCRRWLQWKLYNINEDFSQCNNLAEKMPDKLKEMQALFATEPAKYNVFPLDNTALSRLQTPRPSAVAGKTVFTYTGENSGIPLGNAPDILDKDYTITAEVTIPEGGAEGIIVTLGGRFGGYGLYLLKGKPVFVYNLLDLERFRWEDGVGADDWPGSGLKPGKHTLVFDFKYDGPGPGKGGTGVFAVDGKELARKKIEHSIPLMMTIDETFHIGVDTRTGVDDSYKLPFRFTGTIDMLLQARAIAVVGGEP